MTPYLMENDFLRFDDDKYLNYIEENGNNNLTVFHN
jgi:hypothetical protein